jgi:hypothetical protein
MSQVEPGSYRAKLLSIGYLSRGRTQARVREGRQHPDSGKPFKAVKDELGNVVTEHGARGSGVSDRQDVNIHAPHVTGRIDG